MSELVFQDSFIEFREARSLVEAEIIAIKIGMQHVLQEGDVSEQELTIITGSHALISWWKGNCMSMWELPFERNLFMNIKEWLKNVAFHYIKRSMNPWQGIWNLMMENHVQQLESNNCECA